MTRTASLPAPPPGEGASDRDIGNVAVLGAGHLGGACIAGLLRSGWSSSRLYIAESDPDRRSRIAAESGAFVSDDVGRVVAESDLILVAVRPGSLRQVLETAAPHLVDRCRLLVSFAAGIPREMICRWCCGGETVVVRAMPNLAISLNRGAIALFAPGLAPEHHETLEKLLGRLGRLYWLKSEEWMDGITALAGSGPAYFFHFMACLRNAAASRGMDPALATDLVLQTGQGSLELADQGGGDFERLREGVTSPGGTTAAALEQLRKLGFETAVTQALMAAWERGTELAQQARETETA